MKLTTDEAKVELESIKRVLNSRYESSLKIGDIFGINYYSRQLEALRMCILPDKVEVEVSNLRFLKTKKVRVVK